MKIIDLRCAVIGKNPVVRIVTDEGISFYGEVESTLPHNFIAFARRYLSEEDKAFFD